MDILIAEDSKDALVGIARCLHEQLDFQAVIPADNEAASMPALNSFWHDCKKDGVWLSHPLGHRVYLVGSLRQLDHAVYEEASYSAAFFDLYMVYNERTEDTGRATEQACVYIDMHPQGPVFLISSDNSYHKSTLENACRNARMNMDAVTRRLKMIDKRDTVICREISQLLKAPNP